MTVYIHPKDQGPIDTRDDDRCESCEKHIKRRGKRVTKPGRRPIGGRRHTYLNVCPYCKEDPDSPLGNQVVTHHECNTTFRLLDAPNCSWRSRDTLCPKCKEPLSEDEVTIHEGDG